MDHAIVVVLGDIGHSPRICYHALSLANKDIPVQLVGYMDSRPHEKIISHPLISIVRIPSPPDFLNVLPSIFSLLFKLIWLCLVVPFTLFFRTSFTTSIVMIQNPPGVPTMFFAWLAAVLKRGNLVIDWHNYTCSMVRYKHRLDDPKQKKNFIQLILGLIADTISWYEGYFGRLARWNLCVSNSMRNDLRKRWNVKSVTHYDRPQSWNMLSFNDEKKHSFYFYLRDHPEFSKYISKEPHSVFQYNLGEIQESTLFSYRNIDGNCHLRPNRPLILVSSTSWTEDEDFGILLEALRKYDSANALRSKRELPDFFVVITGKGPLKERYLEEIRNRKWNHVTIITPWLEAEDYPKILACADLGVSLHASTSGLDLPMKVVDMLGCRVPVLAKSFPAIGELVKTRNGLTFDNSAELYHHLVELASGFPQKSSALDTLKKQIVQDGQIDWECQWEASFWPLLQGLVLDSVDEFHRHRRLSDSNISDGCATE
ncbi:hypothetical protein FO519_002889 [Halicephalobus sp. NKZ332]|nr:hypothetical protein FO519_002889 [Halicephalobus sp. NKZ332]